MVSGNFWSLGLSWKVVYQIVYLYTPNVSVFHSKTMMILHEALVVDAASPVWDLRQGDSKDNRLSKRPSKQCPQKSLNFYLMFWAEPGTYIII